MKYYIAGKITGNPNYREEFAKAERILKAEGHTVMNPCKDEGFSYKEYIDMGLNELMRCDGIYILPTALNNSDGAILEMRYAQTVGLHLRWAKETDEEVLNNG